MWYILLLWYKMCHIVIWDFGHIAHPYSGQVLRDWPRVCLYACMHMYVNITSTGFGAAFCGLVSFHSSVKSLALSQFLPHTHTHLSLSIHVAKGNSGETHTDVMQREVGRASEHTMQFSTSHFDTTQRTCTRWGGLMPNVHTDSPKKAEGYQISS